MEEEYVWNEEDENSLSERLAVAFLANPLRSPSVSRPSGLSSIALPLTPGSMGDLFDNESYTTFSQACFNAFNILAGIGVLSLSFAFKQTGWITGTIILVYLCIATNYTGKLIGRCMDCNPKIRTYSDIGHFAFGRIGKLFITTLFCVELASVLAMYLTLMGDNMAKIVGGDWTTHQMMIVSTCVVLPTCWTKRLDILSHLSIIGIISSLLLLVAIVDTGFEVDKDSLGSFHHVNFTNLVAFNSIQNIPYAIGLEISGFAGHAVFPSIYDSLGDKSQFSRLIDVVYVGCSLLYLSMAMIGYCLFASQVDEELTINLYDVASESLVVKFTVVLIVINPFTKFALSLNPLSRILEDSFLDKSEYSELDMGIEDNSWISRDFKVQVLRSFLTLFALTIALLLPSFSSICAFIGAFCSFIVSVIFPALCYLRLYSGRMQPLERGMLYIFVAINCALCIIGTVAVPFGPQEP